MDTFPEWSDDDSQDLDGFLSSPWPDEEADGTGGESSSDPEWSFNESKLCAFTRIVRISAVDDERDDTIDDKNTQRCNKKESRDVMNEDKRALTLFGMAGATVTLSNNNKFEEQQALPPTPMKRPRRLRHKLPILLCKSSEPLEQPSPGNKRVRFAPHTEEHEISPPVSSFESNRIHDYNEFEPSRVTLKHKPKISKHMLQPKKPMAQQDLNVQDSTSRVTVEAYSGKCSSSNWIHNANLFHDTTLPSNSLDIFCRDSALVSDGVAVVPPTIHFSEDDTSSTSGYSGDDSSIADNAMSEQLARAFFSNNAPSQELKPPPYHRQSTEKLLFMEKRLTPPITRTFDQEHRALSVLQSVNAQYQVNNSYETRSAKSLKDMPPASGHKVANRQKWLQGAFKRPGPDKAMAMHSPSTVSGKIEKFGGRVTRASAVQLKKEELERKIASKQQGKPSLKTRWEGRPGHYKKKVVLATYK